MKPFQALRFELDGRIVTLQQKEIVHNDLATYDIWIDHVNSTWTIKVCVDHTVKAIMSHAENRIRELEVAKIKPDPRLAYNQDVYTHLPDDARNWAEGSVYADAIIGQCYRDNCSIKIAANVLNHHFKACVK